MGHPGIDNLRSKIENARWLVMNASLSRMWFLGEPVAVQRRLIKAIGENAGIPLEFKHVEEILRVAGEGGDVGPDLTTAGAQFGRKELAESIEANTVHGSDAPETAATEIAYFFRTTEICPRG